MNYEELLIEADNSGLTVKELPLRSNDGRIKGKRIAIRQDIPTLAQKADVLAEELGHYHTTAGDILNQNDISNRKQELKARLWAYDRLIGLPGIIKGHHHRCQNRYELAEYLDVTEEFLQEALDYYSSKYGPYAIYGNYLIRFQPRIAVVERFQNSV